MDKTFASLFSGGELAGIGAQQAGYTLLWGIEYDAKIAAVANKNLGGHVTVANVLDCDPADFERPDALHASPTCTRASMANKNGGETPLDLALADKVCEFIRVLQPDIFTLENVRGYRHFESFGRICATLDELGYVYTVEHLNAYEYNVPQSRIRLWVRAKRHGLLMEVPRKRGPSWYEAIEDLIDTCPENPLAPWQIKALEKSGVNYNALVDPQNSNKIREGQDVNIHRGADSPSWSICSKPPNIVLIDGNNARTNGEPSIRDGSEPGLTVTSGRTSCVPKMTDGFTTRQLTPRCVARLQTVPDWYELPDGIGAAVKIIGNGVPCELARRIYRSV
jgi:DNA (cytosine-5)-methyltransferase 1